MEAAAVVGFGDDIMASGMAKDLGAKRAAFGDGKTILWGPWSEQIFRHNPKVARPGDQRAHDLMWIDYYKGHRKYNRLNAERTHWVWNYDFKPTAGEIVFDAAENEFADRVGRDFIVIEPNLPLQKTVAVNKDWRLRNYQAVADRLLQDGHDVVQFTHGRDRLRGVRQVETPKFRDALAVLSHAKFAVLPEGGLHHGAAALGIKAVVIFGGFIPPAVTGYPLHINLTGGAEGACGSLSKCSHCRKALDNISVDEVCSHIH